MAISDEAVVFTEAFRKGYAMKSNRLRRLRFPWKSWPEAKGLFEHFMQQNTKGTWKRSKMSSANWVEDALKRVHQEFGVELDRQLHLTAYSLRISLVSILFHCNLTAERIKWYVGWSLNGTAWFTYVRDIEVTP